MPKIIITAAASALFFTAAPAFAQDAGCRAPGFNGPHGSATILRDRPSSDPTQAAPGRRPGFEGPHGSASNLRDRPSSDPTEAAPGRRPGFEGPHGSASNLRDRPSSDPTAAHLRRATLSMRKTGGDGTPAYTCN